MMPFEPDEQDMQSMPGISEMSSEEESTMVALPGFQAGGRVERDGLAVVHKDEYIIPAPGSKATIVPDTEGMLQGQVINYYFPVEVEVVGALSNTEMERVAQYMYDQLNSALLSQPVQQA